MPTLTTVHRLNRNQIDLLCQPRGDLLVETDVTGEPGDNDQPSSHQWALAQGPFISYRRTVHVEPDPDTRPAAGEQRDDNSNYRVTEVIDYRLATWCWSPLVNPLMSRALRSLDRHPRSRWWWPRPVVEARTAGMVSVLVVISAITGYLGVIIGQTITFAAQDFGSSDSVQANTLAATRVGVLISLVLLHRADRIGRRPLILGFAAAAVVFTAAGALSPNIWVLGTTQMVARGLTTGLITLLVLACTEEVPAGYRAFSISLVTISAALGAGMVLWVLPVSDMVAGGWRIVYVVPLLFLPVLWAARSRLPETRRFDAAGSVKAPGAIRWSRFWLLATAGFFTAVFLSPASQLRNEYLNDDLGFSAGEITVFQLVISLPASAAIIAAGWLADRYGRRALGATALAAGTVAVAISYQIAGVMLWFVASAGVVLTAMAFPAIRGYQTELFPTRSRARIGALLDVTALTGSAVGLVGVGYLADRWDDLGRAIATPMVGPIMVAVIIIALFPETARQELEVFNPSDPPPTSVRPG